MNFDIHHIVRRVNFYAPTLNLIFTALAFFAGLIFWLRS